VGIFALLAMRLGKARGWVGFGPELYKLGKYALTVIVGLLLHGCVPLSLLLRFLARRSVAAYLTGVLPTLTTAFSTASSSATLPLTMECVAENNRVSHRTASFVLPLGATVNVWGDAVGAAIIDRLETWGCKAISQFSSAPPVLRLWGAGGRTWHPLQ